MDRLKCGAAAAIVSLVAGCGSMAPMPSTSSGMTFFVTSTGSGKGADYGGLAGADQHCQALAAAAGAGNHTWHAYLSTQGPDVVNARDRIGPGPWRNANGVVIAKNLAELHGYNDLNKQTALTEKREIVNGFGDTPNRHDVLTGSQPDGTAFGGSDDMTCGNWTKSAGGSAMVGHADRKGLSPPPAGSSWNSAHETRGCSDAELATTGSAGYLYCFATN
ncbi:MAG: hypothetical protein ACHP7B_00035 [Burkholderiales bacterium]